MATLNEKRILVGVTGGIAAYKSAELVRRLRDAGAEVRVVMTPAACAFITPLALQALSGNPVHRDLLDETAEAAMGHIELARWAELVLVAPATADFLARLAHGLANDLLAALCLATGAPILLAPAMNQAMWRNRATQDNCRVLAERGIALLGPDSGLQACGDTGPGRMLEAADLVAAATARLATGELEGLRVMVTAGPTREALDPVRYISNHSSGKMGYAIAAAAAEAGACVTLVSGPVQLATPPQVERIDVCSALEMHAAVMQRVAACDVFIACAAVADYRPENRAEQKIKKTGERIELRLVRNPDIVADVAGATVRPFTVGFAAETTDVVAHARGKLAAKGLDLIVANDVARSDIGFNSEFNEVCIISADDTLELPRGSKGEIARALVAAIADRYRRSLGEPPGRPAA